MNGEKDNLYIHRHQPGYEIMHATDLKFLNMRTDELIQKPAKQCFQTFF